MYFWYTVTVFLMLVEMYFLFLIVDFFCSVGPMLLAFHRKHGKYLWTVIVVILLAVAIQIFKNHDFYKYLNNGQPDGLLPITLKYSLNILLGFLEFALGYIFYQMLVDKISEVKSRQSKKGAG